MNLKEKRWIIVSAVCAALLILVNVLTLQGWLGNPTEQTVFGINTFWGHAGLQAAVNIAGMAICAAYAYLSVKKEYKAGTVLLALVSPAAAFVLQEEITGNLPTMNHRYLMINVFLCYALLAAFVVFFKSTRRALILFNIIVPVIGLVEYYVYQLAGRAFSLADLKVVGTAADVMAGYTYELGYLPGLMTILVVFLLFLSLMTPDIRFNRFSVLRKAAVIAAFAAALVILADKSFLEGRKIAKVDMWDAQRDYVSKGTFITLLAQIKYLKQEAPEGYSPERVQEIADGLLAEYEEQPEQTVKPENLIVIMNESWSDWKVFENYEESEPITPFIDSMTENTVKGFLHVPVYGGGTANSEYEVLTGNNVTLWGHNLMAYQYYPHEKDYGLARTLKAQGYRAEAIHPGSQKSYNRNVVYDAMGFDDYLYKEIWPEEYNQTQRTFITDQACYDYLMDRYDSKEEGEKLFTFLVTIQNHGGYDRAGYESTVKLDMEGDFSTAEQYLSLMKDTDKAFESLIKHFEQVDEPTMIVMFGDHLPSRMKGNFYNIITNNGWRKNTQEVAINKYKTPYVIWTNYDQEEGTGPEMSANYFESYILQKAGQELTDYDKCLRALYQKIPVMGVMYVQDAEGNWYSRDDLPENISQILNEYEILQYNNVYGKKDRIDSLFSMEDEE